MRNNKKGFTLIELLAVIVILGVIMAIAIPAMTGYIDDSKKDSMVSSAGNYLSAAVDTITSRNQLPVVGASTCILVNALEIQKGGMSPYTNEGYSDASIVKIERLTSGYTYSIYLTDKNGNCLSATEAQLNGTTQAKRGLVQTSNCTPVIDKKTCTTTIE